MAEGDLGRVYRDGEILVRQGDAGDCMYVIQEGQAEIYVERDGKEILLRTAHAGEVLGEMALFERVVRSASVRAKGDMRALTVDKRNFLRRINEDPSLAFRLVKLMSAKVREMSDEVARLRSES
ncbi:MAG: cyclic nucleotide-binding domain-containing protein [Planctomycetota bacterium]